MHDNDNPRLVFSPLCQSVSRDNVTVEVHIVRLAGEDDWTLEIVDQDDGSTVWNDPFDSDAEALDVALNAIDKNGISAFLVQTPGTLQ